MKRVFSIFILTALCAAAICEDVSSADTPAKIKCPKKDTAEITFLLMGTSNDYIDLLCSYLQQRQRSGN